MEHLYSTQIINRRPGRTRVAVLPGIGTAAHEYFHVWNVKRVRPAALGPFDYTREQYQPSLWVAEGWTQYYGLTALHRAGIIRPRRVLRDDGAASIQRQPHRAGPQGSLGAHGVVPRALLGRRARSRSPPTAANTFFTYYTKGAGLALYLDLWLRAKTDNRRSLDDVFDVAQAPELERTERVVLPAGPRLHGGRRRARGERDRRRGLHRWFERYVGGTEDLDYDALLAGAGLRLVRGDRWTIEEMPDATPAQLVVRRGWITGRRG